MTKKDKEKGPDKINFEDLSTVFENNLKIYNQYVESFKNLGAAKIIFQLFQLIIKTVIILLSTIYQI